MWSDCFPLQLTHASPGTPTQAPPVPRARGQLAEAASRALQADRLSLPAASCRYLPGDSAGLFPAAPSLAIPYPSVTASSPSLFLPASPGFLPLTNQQLFRSPRRASPSSLPGRLSRALSLGTIPSLTRAGKRHLGIGGPGGSWAPGLRCVQAGGTGFTSCRVHSAAALHQGTDWLGASVSLTKVRPVGESAPWWW